MPCDSKLGLARTARLRQRAEYRRVYELGARAAGRYVVLFVLRRNGGESPSRLGVTASRHVGGAVVRARCKRRIRELFRLHRAALPAEPVDVVVNARRGCADVRWDELRRDYLSTVRVLRERVGG